MRRLREDMVRQAWDPNISPEEHQRNFNEALSYWLDHPEMTFGDKETEPPSPTEPTPPLTLETHENKMHIYADHIRPAQWQEALEKGQTIIWDVPGGGTYLMRPGDWQLKEES